MSTYLGIDIGAETVKLVVVEKRGDRISLGAHQQASHHKDPHAAIRTLFESIGQSGAQGIAATGRLQRVLRVPAVPTKAAMRRGLRLIHPELEAATVISIGAHGFSVLELGARGEEWFQQNSRCSQGTGNFLTQLVQRFGMTVEEASELCDSVKNPAPLSGRCPVILKTDMTHLANKGEAKERILAGLYDAVCENVLTLVRPRLSPPDVVLIGGVARSHRVRRTIGRWLESKGMRLVPYRPEHDVLEAVGAATHAMEHPCDVMPVEQLLATAVGTKLEQVPALRSSLDRVKRLRARRVDVAWTEARDVFMGLDIGSTGSKAVAVEVGTGEVVWETYLNTEGAPVQAAQSLIARWVDAVADRGRIRAVGVTGSGREVVGSLLRTCYGDERVFIMNEIAAHARGASQVDPEVDTIFEIGGQDAKYIRLDGGRVIDAAMNEACSAGTGSFIAEQGAKFEGVGNDVVKLGAMAIGADRGISLGQHCSVFMAEVIDEAITQGVDKDVIVAGLYDSVIQNYLNRVKGPRTVGQRVFCQGMPFSSDALAAAVARQTGRDVVVPPNPGTIGAFGIALLALDELGARAQQQPSLDPQVFLGARVTSKETFVCNSTKGCGGSGNHCRIDRLTTVVQGVTQKFIWGGNCSLYDKGVGRKKLPDLSPDPFRARDELIDEVVASTRRDGGAPVVGMTDEFALRGLAPLFLTFLYHLGMDTKMVRHATGKTLRRGIEGARIPYCAPMQLYHGVFFDLVEDKPDYLLLPMLEELPAVSSEQYSTLCPIVQASPDLVGSLIENDIGKARILRPIIRFDGAGYEGESFRSQMRKLADHLGRGHRFESALRRAIDAQRDFEDRCMQIGRDAIEFCRNNDVVPVVVLGRPYTIHNDVLNSNVPTILRSLGAMPIPVDCLPVPDDAPVYDHQYWAYTQRNLRAADYVRRTPGMYSVFCSNYACGPDSFTLHFYSYIMQGKPFAVVETDGHSGDAGTKTRMEAFLFCVDSDLKSDASSRNRARDLNETEQMSWSLRQVKDRNALLLVPRMGPGAEVAAAALRAEGIRAECMPMPDRDDVRMGRRYTSGKECVPMMLTAGVMLNRIEKARNTGETFALVMPTARGPCRFGVYNVLHKIILEQTGWKDRVGVFSPDDGDYFRETSPEFSARMWAGFMAHDLVEMMLLDVRPVERVPGAANRIYKRAMEEIIECMERPPKGSKSAMLRELFGGLWGTREIVQRAAKEMSAIKNRMRDVPAVAVVGEIYVRLDPFANDFIVEKLEQRGLKVRFAPFIEWLEYTSYLAEERVIQKRMRSDDNPISIGLTGLTQRATLESLYGVVAKELGWGKRTTVAQTLETANPYINTALTGEAVLTLGGPVHEFRENLIHGVVVVGPHECMPCKISEAQFGKVAEEMNLPYLVFELNGDPIDTEALDRFAYDIHEAHRRGLGKELDAVLARGGTDARVPDRSGDDRLVPLRVPSSMRRSKTEPSALD
jgi:predicted CoA-substrate-specific enzyme activase